MLQSSPEAPAGDSHVLDPDAVERATLTALRDEAIGAGTLNGVGMVPIRTGGSVTWYDVDVAALRAAPTAATYALGGESDSMRTRAILAGLLVVGGVLFLAVWFFWPRAGEHHLAMRSVITANGVGLNPWPARSILVTDNDAGQTKLSVSTSVSPTDTEPTAIWDGTQLIPLRLCLPGNVLTTAQQITLVSGNGYPDRIFVLTTNTDNPDIHLASCDGRATPRTAIFQRLELPADAGIGDTRTLADGNAATLTAITLMGPGDDPTLPSGQARITVQVNAAITDWTSVAPTLLLPSGQTRLPAEAPITDDDVTSLTYLVPLPASSLEIAWSLTPASTAQPTRWRATLPAPPDRATVVADALAIEAVVPILRDGTLTLTVTVRNRRDLPFFLRLDEMTLTRSNGAETFVLTAPTPTAFADSLAPGATRTFTLTASVRGDLTEPLILTVGAQRVRIGRET